MMVNYESFPGNEDSRGYPDTIDEWRDAGFSLFDVDEKTGNDEAKQSDDFTDVGGTDPIADLDDASDR